LEDAPGFSSLSSMRHRISCIALVAVTFAVAPSAALAKKSCGDVPFRDRTQAPHNAAGLIFVPHGDVFRIWDNKRDNYLVRIWFNYAGVKDKWKYVGSPSDGGQGPIIRNVKEHRQICFYVSTDSPKYGNSPIVRYRTS
jgi:hypothetical protein